MWEVAISSTASSDEVGFKSLDCAFCWVLTMISRGDELVLQTCIGDDLDQGFGHLIVEFEESGSESMVLDFLVAFLEGPD